MKTSGVAVGRYRPAPISINSNQPLVFGKIPAELFGNPKAIIEAVRSGIPGAWLESVVRATGLLETFASILQRSPESLKAAYAEKALDQSSSETILDVVRLLMLCKSVWESNELAMRWLTSSVPALGDVEPISLLDTYEGRRWVSEVLSKVEYGQFC